MRTTAVIATVALAAVLSLVLASEVRAAEIVLRDTYQSSGPVVTLGDVAEVLGSDQRANEQLGRVDLFPAPTAGRQRFVRVREIQDILIRRGENLAKHRFSGANQVAVSHGERVEKVVFEKPINASLRRSANRRVHSAILDYLRMNVSESKWNIEVSLTPEQVRRMQGSVRRIMVSGGAAPWIGTQRFEIIAQRNQGQPVRLRVEALVGLPPSVVVANRPIPRNAIINAADLSLSSEVPRNSAMQAFSSIEEVAGSQAVRNIATGMIVDHESVRAPLMVRRNEIVTVTARSGGIRVSTDARAKVDGSLGDLIQVESLHDRTTFYARVCGSREVEVYSPTVRVRHKSPAAGYEQRSGTGGGARRIQLEQPRTARNNKLQRIRKGNWK